MLIFAIFVFFSLKVQLLHVINSFVFFLQAIRVTHETSAHEGQTEVFHISQNFSCHLNVAVLVFLACHCRR